MGLLGPKQRMVLEMGVGAEVGEACGRMRLGRAILVKGLLVVFEAGAGGGGEIEVVLEEGGEFGGEGEGVAEVLDVGVYFLGGY